MISLYLEGNSLLHRVPAWSKLLGLFLIASLMFILPRLSLVLVILGGGLLAYFCARLPYQNVYKLIRVTFWLLLMIFAFNAYTHGLSIALLSIIRLFTLLLVSTMISLTTRLSEMMEVITTLFSPLQCLGINVSKLSLCMILAIRFIPMLYEITHQVKEVQLVRGVSYHPFALIIPVCIRVFKLADEFTQALDARGFNAAALEKKRKIE